MSVELQEKIGVSNALPEEIISLIFYRFKGLKHPITNIIFNILNDRCFRCNKKNRSLCKLYKNCIKHHYEYNNLSTYKMSIYEKLNENDKIMVCFNCAH